MVDGANGMNGEHVQQPVKVETKLKLAAVIALSHNMEVMNVLLMVRPILTIKNATRKNAQVC
jgi:hypothetical protein